MRHRTKYQIGEVVELMSGGEPMTVVVSTAVNTTTTWHDRKGPHTETYPTGCLRLREQRNLRTVLSEKRWDVV